MGPGGSPEQEPDYRRVADPTRETGTPGDRETETETAASPAGSTAARRTQPAGADTRSLTTREDPPGAIVTP